MTPLLESGQTCMGAEPSRISQLDEISSVAYTCQPDRSGGSQEVSPQLKSPCELVGEGGAFSL